MRSLAQRRQSNGCESVTNDEIFKLHLGPSASPWVSTYIHVNTVNSVNVAQYKIVEMWVSVVRYYQKKIWDSSLKKAILGNFDFFMDYILQKWTFLYFGPIFANGLTSKTSNRFIFNDSTEKILLITRKRKLWSQNLDQQNKNKNCRWHKGRKKKAEFFMSNQFRH